ncbi:MAG: excinuclease ABC subunit UvrA [Bacteroidales bacterium]|nr:excinuclease ABC subunit UvrA [Bacteroidales bacterium]MCF8388050.1 excinuclease ABC subunit UvrA [Bacteroidales bacterium]MCF8398558.1 excinuclease ABC subunit UvrA [Bacteroidales bacterium]
MIKDTEKSDTLKNIIIKGAKVHNLKELSVSIPKNKLVVITGLSGSGKSSLAFDTLYADGQRRYVESLSSYARQFLGRMQKPEVDYIKGIAPAIAIEQKVNTKNPRSTVGTSTEIYEYLKLLFARIGKTYSPISDREVRRHSVSDVTNFIIALDKHTNLMIMSPISLRNGRKLTEQLKVFMQQGFSRAMIGKKIYRIEEALQDDLLSKEKQKKFLVIDRIKVDKESTDLRNRIADSVQTAFFEGHGYCTIEYYPEGERQQKVFSNKFELDGMEFEEPSANLFSFNNPYGACKRCEGYGSIIGIDEDLVVPNKSLSVYEDAIACWRGEKMGEWKEQLILNAYKFDFPVHKPYFQLSDEQKELLWEGNEYFNGINDFFQYVEEQTYKIQYRVMLSRYRGKTICPDCKGTRLRKDAAYVKLGGKSPVDLVLMPIQEVNRFFNALKLNDHDRKVAKRILLELKNRLQFLQDVGLGYLTLNRLSSSLSGGESQRINLATSLGSSLVGSLYILDEPSIGLHPRDTHRLIKVLKHLRDIGNTVIVVEHDEEIIKAADQLIDIGPMAGSQGGELVFQGTYREILEKSDGLTSKYLRGAMKVPVPKRRKRWRDYLELKGAAENNLKNINVKFPLNVLTVITGVSGSGKSSLVKKILYPAIKKRYSGFAEKTGRFDMLEGDIDRISSVEFVDQNPIGRSSRSNPATYVKAYDDIRALFAAQQLAKVRAYKPGFFSFNVPGGRCEECEGEGTVKIEMQFMADIYLKCEACDGKRFKEEVLDVKYKSKDISEILDLTVNQAIAFFSSGKKPNLYEKKIIEKLQPLLDVGLGYLKLGQASSTLSGGEAQRIKLAYYLSKGVGNDTSLFIFDEPTTGLHFHDINNLLTSLRALIEKGHTVIVIEHNMEVIKSADWIIDLGPEGGDQGGYIVFEGLPEDLVKTDKSYTAGFLREKL